jgi:hypothetical protein
VVFTLTRFDYIDGVRIFIEGEPIIAVVDSGVVESLPPFARDEFDDLVPPILIETPVYWNWEPDATEPLAVRGTADVFEGTVSLALTDEDGLIIWEGFATAACGTGCRGDWSIEIPYSVPIDQRGALIAWEESAVDGSQLNVREHPVWLIATDIRIDECSGTDVPDDLPDQPGLPVEVAATRRAIFDAARSCDFDALSDLIGERFASFGHDPEDSIRVWMMEEAAEYRTMYWLAQTLRLPAAFDQPEEWPARWVWPSAAAFYPWDSVPEADRTALLEIYAEDDLQAFSEWGAFFMYRLGITPDGEWTFFAVGD